MDTHTSHITVDNSISKPSLLLPKIKNKNGTEMQKERVGVKDA